MIQAYNINLTTWECKAILCNLTSLCLKFYTDKKIEPGMIVHIFKPSTCKTRRRITASLTLELHDEWQATRGQTKMSKGSNVGSGLNWMIQKNPIELALDKGANYQAKALGQRPEHSH